MEADLVVHLASFAGALRARGVAVRLSDELDAATALTLVDVLDRAEVRRALRTALRIRRGDWDIFEEEFARLWSDRASSPRPTRAGDRPRRAGRRGALWQWDGRKVQLASPADGEEQPTGEEPGYSPRPLLRHKSFAECSPSDLTAMERVLARAVARLATRKRRRYVPARRGGKVDLRRSFRRAVGTGGEFLALMRRDRQVKELDLVLLCDTSGSMDPHARFLLTLLLAMRRVARRTEVFAFNTSLTRVTPSLKPGRVGPTVERLVSGVPDWSGGTRIGESLAEFVTAHQNQMVTSKTIVVIVSDGLDTGDAEVLVRAMRAIHTRARKVFWLNPLLGDPRYEPSARGMQAALPFIDHFAPAHTLGALEQLLPRLSG